MQETEMTYNTNLIALNQSDIVVIAGEIQFDKLPELKESVNRFVEKMTSVDVTTENMQQSKKLIAATRKELNFINEERKRVEKFYTEPLEVFKAEIREISNTVTKAEDYVRDQVREMENAAREEKEAEVNRLFDLHVRNYELFDVMTFKDFMKPSYSNKTISLNKVEEELVEWLQKTENDLQFLSSQEDGEKLVTEYKDTRDVTTAIQNVQRTREYYRQMAERLKEREKQEAVNEEYRKTKEVYIFEVDGSERASEVETLLEDNHIAFRKRVK